LIEAELRLPSEIDVTGQTGEADRLFRAWSGGDVLVTADDGRVESGLLLRIRRVPVQRFQLSSGLDHLPGRCRPAFHDQGVHEPLLLLLGLRTVEQFVAECLGRRLAFLTAALLDLSEFERLELTSTRDESAHAAAVVGAS